MKILSDDPQSKAGEIVTRGTNVMIGYYKNDEATKAVLDDNGWFHTGDLGKMSADGHVFIRAESRICSLEPMGRIYILKKLRTS